LVSKEKLMQVCTDAVGVSVAWRTIAGDINAMRNDEQLGYNAPIENVRNLGYRYSDANFSIDQIPLQIEEITALSFAANLLKQYSHVDIFSTFSGAVEKLNQNLDLQLRNKDQADLGAFIAFEDNTSDGGSRYLNDILQHIRQQTVISVLYDSFSSGSRKKHIIHPYFIKEYRNRWYVLGYHEQYKEMRTLALERIIELAPDYAVQYKPSTFDAAAYYKDAIGVSILKSSPQNIELKVTKTQWQYLSSQPLHPSQKLQSEHENDVIIELMVIANYELKSQLLSMGSSVAVLKPASLRLEMEEETKRILENYQN
jgi:predicted DNA-binding transcriptional regulator YafY